MSVPWGCDSSHHGVGLAPRNPWAVGAVEGTVRFRPDDPFWVVTDPTPDSTLADICFETTLRSLERQLRGGLTIAENPTIFTDRVEAEAEARVRLVAQKTTTAILRTATGYALDCVLRFELKDAAGKVILEGELR